MQRPSAVATQACGTPAAAIPDHAFALVCIEASLFVAPDDPANASYSVWEIPPVMGSATGATPCADADSRDIALVENTLASLDPEQYDLSRLHFV